MQEPSEAAVRAYARLLRAQRAVIGDVEAALKAAGFPPVDWYDVLLELRRAREQRLPPRDLEREMLFVQCNLSRLLDRMAAEGLVRRLPFPGDGRRQLVEITKQGRALQKRMWPIYAGAIERAVGSKLTCEEATALGEALGKLLTR